MLKGFKDFLLRGNLVTLAVAFVMGVAFGAVVNSLVKDIITPIIGAIFGKPDFSGLFFTINGSRFAYGSFINAVLSFIFVAAAVYFFVVVPVNAFMARAKPPAAPGTRECPECKSEIPAAATRCAFCTAQVTPASE
jgi:large conductance mechanosensitive channel